MREIKFRAWNVEDKEWFNVSDLKHNLKFWKGGSDDMGCMHHWEDGCVEFCLYTGLKDKNGVEIYEGDIVTGTFHWGGYQGIVKYSDGCFHIAEHGDASFMPFYDYPSHNHKVIGNIYENPELLSE